MEQVKETLKTLIIGVFPDYQRNKLKRFFNHLISNSHFLDLPIRQIVPLETNPNQIKQKNQIKKAGYINNFIFLPDIPEWKDKLANANQQVVKM